MDVTCESCDAGAVYQIDFSRQGQDNITQGVYNNPLILICFFVSFSKAGQNDLIGYFWKYKKKEKKVCAVY